MRFTCSLLLAAALVSGCGSSFQVDDSETDAGAAPDASPSDAGSRAPDAARPDAGAFDDAGPGAPSCRDGWVELAHHPEGITEASIADMGRAYLVSWQTLTDGTPSAAWVQPFDHRGVALEEEARPVSPSRVFARAAEGIRIGADGAQRYHADGTLDGPVVPLECGFEGHVMRQNTIWGACADGRLAWVHFDHRLAVNRSEVEARFPLAFHDERVLVPSAYEPGTPVQMAVHEVRDEALVFVETLPLDAEIFGGAASPEASGCAQALLGFPLVEPGSSLLYPRLARVCEDSVTYGPPLEDFSKIIATWRGLRASGVSQGDRAAFVYTNPGYIWSPQLLFVDGDSVTHRPLYLQTLTVGAHILPFGERYAVLSGDGASAEHPDDRLLLHCNIEPGTE